MSAILKTGFQQPVNAKGIEETVFSFFNAKPGNPLVVAQRKDQVNGALLASLTPQGKAA